MPSGYYVYCRAWLGFTDGFPFFDELNPYSDDKIVPEIELRALTWLRSTKPQVRKAYREERTRLQEALSKPLPGEVVQPGPSPLTRKLTARLDTISSEELTQLAEKLQVESRGSKTQIWRALFETLHARLSNPESRGPTIDLLPPSFGLFSFPEPERLTTQVKRAMRGDRSNPLAVRITRLARWTDGTVRRLGGLSPTPTLYLGWLENEELARQVLEAFRLRSQSIGWHEHSRLKFGLVPAEILGVDRAAAIEMDLKELQNRNHRWTGTPIHQAVHREYIQVVAEVCTVGLRAKPVRASSNRNDSAFEPTSAQPHPQDLSAPVDQPATIRAAYSAEEAIRSLGVEYATVRQLAHVTGRSDSAVRSRIFRAIENNPNLAVYHVEMLPNPGPFTAKKSHRIRAFWEYVQPDSEHSQDK